MDERGRVTEDTDLHHRVLKRHYIDVADARWEVSTVGLVEEPEDILEAFTFLVDMAHEISEKYETMIFKIDGDERVGSESGGATSFGHYRSNDSQDVVRAHIQMVELIAGGKLVPVECKSHSDRISPHILKAMEREASARVQYPASPDN
jgi:hypothetical protein